MTAVAVVLTLCLEQVLLYNRIHVIGWLGLTERLLKKKKNKHILHIVRGKEGEVAWDWQPHSVENFGFKLQPEVNKSRVKGGWTTQQTKTKRPSSRKKIWDDVKIAIRNLCHWRTSIYLGICGDGRRSYRGWQKIVGHRASWLRTCILLGDKRQKEEKKMKKKKRRTNKQTLFQRVTIKVCRPVPYLVLPATHLL